MRIAPVYARFAQAANARSASNLNREKIEWSEWDEYAVLGNRRMDCIGRVVTRPSDWEYRESTTWKGPSRTGISDEGRSEQAGR